MGDESSVARLGRFPPNWGPFGHVGLEKVAMGRLIKFGLPFTTFGVFSFLERILKKYEQNSCSYVKVFFHSYHVHLF